MGDKANRKLEAARLQKRWSIAVASKKIGVSVNTFNRWERGLQRPHPQKLDQLCQAFAMSPQELGFEPDSTPEHSATEITHEQIPTDNPSTGSHSPATPAPEEAANPLSPPASDRFALSTEQFKNDREKLYYALNEHRSDEEISRKQAIAFLVEAPLTVFRFARNRKDLLLYSDEILSLCATSLPLCWQLYYEGGCVELNRILPEYILHLSALAQLPSRQQAEAARLASQAHQLGYLLALQRRNYGTSLEHTQNALHYGAVARDFNLQAASLARRAYVYSCMQRHTPQLQAYQEALRHPGSPLLKGYIYAGIAETYAHHGNEPHAREFLQYAREHYPDRPEDDPAYAYTHFRWPTFYTFAGKTYLHLQQPRQAWEAFATVERLVPIEEKPYRLELTVNQAATALALKEVEQSCTLLASAAQTARALESDLRYDEAYNIYERLQERWGQEPAVKALADLFS